MVTPALVMDVDQVLLDYISRLRDYFNATYDRDVRRTTPTWDMTEWLGLDDPSQTQAVIDEFATNWQFGTLDAFPGADVVLHDIRLRLGMKLVAVTACGRNLATQALRKANLFHRFGDIFEEIHFVEYTESKYDAFVDLNGRYDIAAVVDDRPENLMAAHEAGIRNIILMKQKHNIDYRSQFVSTSDWYEVRQVIYDLLP